MAGIARKAGAGQVRIGGDVFSCIVWRERVYI